MSEDQTNHDPREVQLILSSEDMVAVVGESISLDEPTKLAIGNFLAERCEGMVSAAVNDDGAVDVVKLAQMYQLSIYKLMCDNAAAVSEYVAQQEIVNAEPVSHYYH